MASTAVKKKKRPEGELNRKEEENEVEMRVKGLGKREVCAS